ncbi:MAG TPA: tannase/feruloyl esterase family alpha/beta hydrolase, partial [Geminicoccaceae bacterium]
MACADLKGLDLSRGGPVPARVDSAEEAAVGARQVCVVKGYVAPQVNFEARLPLEGWTQRYLQLGCGGYCGGINLASPSALRQAAGCAPAESGEMVVASSDLGHRRSGTFFPDGVWAVGNPDAVVDFAYGANHKVALAVKSVAKAFYGQEPRYAYFNGCSDGGRQGLQEAQRFPEDFDGILAGSTTLDVTSTNTVWHAWNVRVNSRPDGSPILTADKVPALAEAVLKACAGPDGLIADPRACGFKADALVCPAGRDDASCLTAEQAEAATRIWQGPVDERGDRLFPGGMPYGSERAWIGSMVPEKAGDKITLATASDYQWSWDFPNFMSAFGEVTGVTNRNMEFTRAGYERMTRLRGLYDPTDPDLTRFAARGGKLLMWHGWADSGSSPLGSLNYVTAVRERMGADAAGVVALYLVPGVYHCSAGPTPVRADYLSQLMAWVEDGKAPGSVSVAFEGGPKDPTVTRTIT